MIILLVDKKVTYKNLNECIATNTNVIIITFGFNLNDIPGVYTYVVTDLNSAVKAALNYYK